MSRIHKHLQQRPILRMAYRDRADKNNAHSAGNDGDTERPDPFFSSRRP
jgi:hypothetical protein